MDNRERDVALIDKGMRVGRALRARVVSQEALDEAVVRAMVWTAGRVGRERDVALIAAVKDKGARVVRALVAGGVSQEALDVAVVEAAWWKVGCVGREALRLARVVRALVAGGVSQEALDVALLRAARLGRAEIVRALVGAGADVNARDAEGRTALDAAVRTRSAGSLMASEVVPARVEVVRALVAGGVSQEALDEAVEWVGSEMGWERYGPDGREGAEEMMRALVGAGVSKKVLDAAVFQWMRGQGGGESVRRMVEAGVSKKARGKALCVGSSGNKTERARVLIEAGVSQEALDEALLRAAEAGAHEVVRLLIEAGADVNARDAEGRTALDAAVAGFGGPHGAQADARRKRMDGNDRATTISLIDRAVLRQAAGLGPDADSAPVRRRSQGGPKGGM